MWGLHDSCVCCLWGNEVVRLVVPLGPIVPVTNSPERIVPNKFYLAHRQRYLLWFNLSRCKRLGPSHGNSRKPRTPSDARPRLATDAGKDVPSVLGILHTHAKHVETLVIPASTPSLRNGLLSQRAILLSFKRKLEEPSTPEMTAIALRT